MARLTPDDEGYALEVNDELKALLAARYAIVVGGHTHRRMIRTLRRDDLREPRTPLPRARAGFLLLDTTTRVVEVHLFGPDRALSSTHHRLDDRFP